jgi:hypothetical protein
VRKARQVYKARQVQMVPQEHKALPDLLVLLAQQVSKDLQELMELQALKV